MTKKDEITDIKKELKFKEDSPPGILRNKILKLQSLFGRINTLLDGATKRAETQAVIVEKVWAKAIIQVNDKNRKASSKKTPAYVQEAQSMYEEVEHPNTKKPTTLADEKDALAIFISEQKQLRNIHKECESGINSLRSALSWDKQEMGSQ